MRFACFRLTLAAVLFIGWLGWLGYLALDHAKAIIVSRSQALVATHVAVGEITIDASGKPSRDVGVIESSDHDALEKGNMVVVENLDKVQLPDGKALTRGGPYLLFLAQTQTGLFRVVGAPKGMSAEPAGAPRAYPWTSEVESLVRNLLVKENAD